MTGFRISYPETTYPNVYTLDCLNMRRLFYAGEFFAYEDDGTPCWFELEKKWGCLLDGGEFRFSNGRPAANSRTLAPADSL